MPSSSTRGWCPAAIAAGARTWGLIIHLSASTALSPYPNAKTLVCTVEEAIKLGADALSIHVNVGNGSDQEMLSDLGPGLPRSTGMGHAAVGHDVPPGREDQG